MADLIGNLLSDTARRRPDHPAVWEAGSTIDYAEIERRAGVLAGFLVHRAIEPGDRIALYCINSADFIVSYFAVMKCGATVVPLNLLLHPDTIGYMLEDSGAVGLIAHAAVADQLVPVADQIRSLRVRVATGPCRALDGAFLLPEVLQADATPPPPPPVDPADHVAAILYTSGTTGQPKGAMLTHRNLLSNVRSASQMIHIEPEDVVVAVLPMFHAFCATACVLLSVAQGCTVAAVPKFQPDLLFNAMQAAGATIFMGVPSMYAVLANMPESRSVDLSGLRYCIAGGAPLPLEVMDRFESRYGVTIYEGDGPTECSPITSVNPVGGRRKPGTIGLPLPDVEMKIIGDDDRELPGGEIGEIIVRGPNVMKGYFNRPEETQAAFLDEWFRTGDLGKVDEDGYFSIVDRKKDLIIVNGMNVYPSVVENVVYRHPAVAECAVVPEPHKLHGEVPRAVIVLREGASCSEAEMREFCRSHLGRHEVPRIIEFRDALPKSATGKILKRELVRRD
jgi:long-chain acyl-CoA synthetase